MPGTMLTKGRFLSLQGKFYRKVTASPMKIDLVVVTAITPADDYDAFVGDSDRTSKTYSFPCLYKRQLSDYDRTKYGLTAEINGLIWLSPIDIKKQLPDFHIDKALVTSIFAGKKQVLDQVDYLEPYYDTCIAVFLKLKDAHQGGE
jgi:hypothetical protein